MEKKEVKLQALGTGILEVAGGEGNVSLVSHCYTRFRFTVKDMSKVDEDELKAIDGVLGVVAKGNEYQVVIGSDAENLYKEFIKLGEFKTAGNVERVHDGKRRSWFIKLLDFLGETFTPLIPILLVGGIIGAVLNILTNFFGVTADSGTYIVFYALSRTAFYFLPIFIGFSAAKKLNINQYLGGMLGAFLLFSTINLAEGLTFLGIKIPAVTYNTTVFSVLLGVGFMFPVYKFLDKHMPNAIKSIFLPLITMIIVVPVTFIVFSPIGNTIGGWVSDGIYSLYKGTPILAVIITGLIYPILVFFGLGNALYPIAFSLLESVGYDPLIMAGILSANIAVGAACLAIGIKSGNANTRGVGISTGITSFCGIAEPGIYSILLPLRTPFIGAIIGGGLGAILAAVMKIAGRLITLPSLVSLSIFKENEGSATGLFQAFIVAVVSAVVAFAATWILYNDKGE